MLRLSFKASLGALGERERARARERPPPATSGESKLLLSLSAGGITGRGREGGREGEIKVLWEGRKASLNPSLGGQTDGHTDRQIGRQADRQTDVWCERSQMSRDNVAFNR